MFLNLSRLFNFKKPKQSEKDDTAIDDTQNSLVTIFSIWIAMMGSTLLTLPWAIKQAGFANGIMLLIAMAVLMTYTSYRVITSGRYLAEKEVFEFSDAVRIYLGKFAEGFALFASLVSLQGICIAYWILMSSALYHIVVFIYVNVHDISSNWTSSNGFKDVVCLNNTGASADLPKSFKSVWDETNTVPLFLIILVFPLINFKAPTFFTKFNVLGVLTTTFQVIFVSVKAGEWGFHLNFEDSSSVAFSENFSSSFVALTGVASLSYYLHCGLLTIMRPQRHPENNTRDLIIAYCLVCITYVFIGAMFYASFPLQKSCIADNLLENLDSTDVISFIARLGLFIQLTSVLPLIMYVIRTQLLQFVFNDVWPSVKHVLVFNIAVVVINVLFAVFLPKIGRILSFVGSFCGMSYGIALPCLVYVVSTYQQGKLTRLNLAFHCLLIVIGVANFIAQFFVI